MKNIFIACILFMSYAINCQTVEPNFLTKAYIEINGKAELEIVPNRIYINIKLSEKDNKNKFTISELEKKMIESLQKMGVDISKELQLLNYSSNFKSRLLTSDNIILTKEYQLLVKDGKTLDMVVKELEIIGISNISIEKTDHSNMEQFRNEVKIKAMKHALDDAQILTNAVGQKAGKVLFIQEQYSNIYTGRSAKAGIMRAESTLYEAEAIEPEVDFEKIKLEYSVLVRFEILW
jgi:uncharacterized protein YggE